MCSGSLTAGAVGSVDAVGWVASVDHGGGCGHEQRPVLRRDRRRLKGLFSVSLLESCFL